MKSLLRFSIMLVFLLPLQGIFPSRAAVVWSETQTEKEILTPSGNLASLHGTQSNASPRIKLLKKFPSAENADKELSLIPAYNSEGKARTALLLTIIGVASIVVVPVLAIVLPALPILWTVLGTASFIGGLVGFVMGDSLIRRRKHTLSRSALAKARWARGLGWGLIIFYILSLVAVLISFGLFYGFSFQI